MHPRRLDDRVLRSVVVITGLALVGRGLLLGQRIAHWDEGRVAYWVLRYAETGAWTYRPIVHGPFLKHTTRVVFETLGATDATMRLVVAVVGGCLPLAALCLRSPDGDPQAWHLSDRETVALAVLLAVNPLLLYFSRFLRSDVPLAAFSLVAFGLFVRGGTTGRGRDALAGVVALAFAATTKENVLLYLLSWAGAAAMVVATGAWRREAATVDVVRSGARAVGTRLWTWRRHLLAGGAVLVAVVVFFYAPRAATPDGTGLWNALAGRAPLAAVVEEATVGAIRQVADVWLADEIRGHAYAPFLAHYVVVLLVGGGVVSALAVVGLLEARDRPLVAFAGWWGLSAVVGYPLAADLKAPWLTVHAVVALVIPAAVGLSAVLEDARDALEADRPRVAAAFVGLLVVSTAHVGVVAVGTSYTYPMPGANVVAQSAQPGSDLRPVLDRIERVARAHDDGSDVLYYGDLAVANESDNDDPPAAGSWYERLPLPWYTERAGATVTSARSVERLPAELPPVVVVRPSQESAVADRMDGYRRYERGLFLLPENRTVRILGHERRFGGRSLVYYVDRDAVRGKE